MTDEARQDSRAAEGARTKNEAQQDSRAAEGSIEIEASPERVWRALTEADELERWFPLEAQVEPGKGGRIWMSWGNEYGAWSQIEAWDPPRHLRTSWGFGSEPAQVTDYLLRGEGGRTRLRVVTSGFPPDGDWDDLVEGTRLGWFFELRQLKLYLERHDGRPRRALYFRRRTDLSRAEIWSRLTGPGGIDLQALSDGLFDHTPHWQIASVTSDPPGGLFRLTVDPSHTDPGLRDVTVWLSAWGTTEETLDRPTRRWKAELRRLFPSGEELESGC